MRNIENAAAEIGAIQKKNGSDGAFAAINECYKRELAHATALTPQLEACMAQDIVVSQVTAGFYSKICSRLSQEQCRTAGAEEPEAVLKAMNVRVARTMLRFKVPQVFGNLGLGFNWFGAAGSICGAMGGTSQSPSDDRSRSASMSALERTTDLSQRWRHVRKVPTADFPAVQNVRA